MHPLRKLRESATIIRRRPDGRQTPRREFSLSQSSPVPRHRWPRGRLYPLSAALTMAIPFFAGMVRFRGMSSRALRSLPDNDQGLLAERTTAYRPLSALQIFRDLMYPKLEDVLPPEYWIYAVGSLAEK
jgi:hypothetical protein